ncbi:hypothetical protein BGX26_006009, partial [Mortierella sp. AD094]
MNHFKITLTSGPVQIDLTGLVSDSTQTDGDVAINSEGDVTETESSTSLRRQHSAVNGYTSSADFTRQLFVRNYESYGGLSLILGSGKVFDQSVLEFALLSDSDIESSLHSFILFYGTEQFRNVLGLFDAEDQEQLQQLCNKADNIYSLPDWKINVINYFKTPYSVEELVFEGWNHVFRLEGPTPEGYKEFVKMIVDFMNDILVLYKEYGQELVGHEITLTTIAISERSFLTLWGVFFKVLSKNNRLIDFAQGEISSIASATRRNAGRTRDNRQNGGHKLDGIFYATRASQAEFGAIEGGKKNENSYGTKYLDDGMKLAKALKDMFDNVCAKAASNRSDVASLKTKIEVYGFLVSGTKLDF